MALSFVEHLGDGLSNTFAVPFPYIAQDHVRVAVDGSPRAFTWSSPSVVRLAAVPPSKAVVKIYRETPNTERLVDFEDDSIIDEALLDQMNLQLFYIAQEAYDLSATSIVVVADGHYDARARRVKNVADPLEPTDAVNLKTFKSDFLPRLQAEATRAETAANNATSLKSQFDQLFADLLQRSRDFNVAYNQIDTWKKAVSADTDTVLQAKNTVANTATTVAGYKTSIEETRAGFNQDATAAKADITLKVGTASTALDAKVAAAEAAKAAAEASRIAAEAARIVANQRSIASLNASNVAIEARDTTLLYKNAIQAVGVDAAALLSAVNRAEAAAARAEGAQGAQVTWDLVSGKPTSFPPAAHSHDWGSVSNKPTTFPPDAHRHTWATVDDKPLFYPPEDHIHTWSEIYDKPPFFSGNFFELKNTPSVFPPEAHTHDWASVTGKPTAFPTDWSQVANKPATYAPAAHTHDGVYLPVAGGTLTGPIVNGATAELVRGAFGGVVRGYLVQDQSGIGFCSSGGQWALKVAYGTTRTEAVGDLSVGAALTVVGNVTANGNVTAYSDARLKKDVERIEGALQKVQALRGVTYTRKDSGERQTGVIAQEVQEVLPEAVQEGEYLSVAYGNLVGLLIEAVKELAMEVQEVRRAAA